MSRKMKIYVIKAFFLTFIFAFLGTQARTVLEHPLDKSLKNNCGRNLSPRTPTLASSLRSQETHYERTPTPPPPSPRSPPGPSPIKVISRTFPCSDIKGLSDYSRAASPPPPSPTSSPPTHQHQLSIGLLLENSPPSPNLAST
ncbi:leucine-rich repeat extensin-like protein 3 isoform X2 [Actinidia eriantha]|uniref:leucine-rich repeat extensin-like protein 3 isoform X2 n=1 Tax=Actinidia eriantha TaxID=165200 RepID=UPI0025881431|nr:leucine-rich repeat extensin-like protein 3 isoform X2 [Actinidia eriantha]